MKTLISTAAIAAVLSLGAVAHAAPIYPGPDLVTNGDFESTTNGAGELSITGGATYNTDLTGWSNGGYNFVFAPGTVDTTGSPSAQFGGNLSLWGATIKGIGNGGANVMPPTSPVFGNFVALDGAFETGALSQTLTGVKAGATVKVAFYYGFGQQYGFDGDTLQNLSVTLGGNTWTSKTFDVQNHGFTGWQYAVATLKAPTANPTLSFSAYGNLPVPPFALLDGVSANAVPEPASWAMMLIGLGGLGALARRRRAVSAVAA